ncbi:MAG: DUF1127 domain-containing protein [Roseovarius sp.]
MSVIEYTRTSTASAGIFGSAFASVRTAFDAWRSTRATQVALSRLSDRELEDIGLSRGDIDRVAAKF